MKKILILVLGLSLTAASCNWLTDPLGFGGGVKGVLKSEDTGQTYKAVNALEKKSNINGVTATLVVFDPNDPNVLYLGSANGVYKSVDGANTWKLILTGIRVGGIAIDSAHSEVVYVAGVAASNGKIIKSTDGGESFTDVYSEPSKNNTALSVAVSKANSKIIIAGFNNGEIIRSLDSGTTWQVVKDIGSPVSKIAFVNSFTAYAMSTSGGLFLSSDQGSNWIIITGTLDQTSGIIKSTLSKSIYDVAFDMRLNGIIFLATELGLFRTLDNGGTWTVMTLPVTNTTLKVSAVAINPTNSNNIYIAIGSTMFKTLNGGVTWETKKLPSDQHVRQILMNPQNPGIIYLGMGEK